MSGRNPKPVPLRVIEGNRGHRKTPREADYGRRAGKFPTPPKSLKRRGADEWKQTGKRLWELGILHEADLTGFTRYCEAIDRYYAVFEEYQRQADEFGASMLVLRTDDNIKINPIIRMVETADERVRKLASDFGLTPSSRAKLMALNEAANIGDQNASKYLNRKRKV